ncbi:MAG: hypothetical protein GY861_18625 [bacterium]|nr:hypothetical protein [bacterium]
MKVELSTVIKVLLGIYMVFSLFATWSAFDYSGDVGQAVAGGVSLAFGVWMYTRWDK